MVSLLLPKEGGMVNLLLPRRLRDKDFLFFPKGRKREGEIKTSYSSLRGWGMVNILLPKGREQGISYSSLRGWGWSTSFSQRGKRKDFLILP